MSDIENVFKSARVVQVVGALVCVTTAVAGIAIVMIPSARDADERERAQRELRLIGSELDQSMRQAEVVRAQIEDLEESLGGRRFRLSTEQDLNAKLAAITTLVESHSMSLERLEPGEGVSASMLLAIPMRLEVLGPTQEVFKLLAVLDQDHPDLHIDEVEIEYVSPGNTRLRALARWLTVPSESN